MAGLKYMKAMRESTLRARALVPGVVLLMAGVLSGCYHYVPVDPATVRPDEEVRVRISDSAARRLANDFGTYLHTLSGQFGTHGPDSLALAVRLSRFTNGVSLAETRQTLLFSRPEVLDVSRRELSVGKTALVTAGVIGGFVLLITSITQLGDENPGSDEPPPPPPPAARGIIRIPIPVGH